MARLIRGMEVKERIVDRTILRLIRKWLKAGVMEEGERIQRRLIRSRERGLEADPVRESKAVWL